MVDRIAAALDTNIFVSVINKEADHEQSKQVLDWIDEGKINGIVSTIVIAEICSGYENAGDSYEKDEFLAHLLGSSNYEIADVTVPIAMDAGSLRSKKKKKLPDALIIASAMHHGAEFLISNDITIGKSPDHMKALTASEFVKLVKQKEESKRKSRERAQ